MKVDLFTAIHKALRSLLYQTALELQHTDPSNPEELSLMLEKLENCISLMEEHAQHEDKLIFPAMERAVPGSTSAATEQHRGYDERLLKLQEHIAMMKSDPGRPEQAVNMAVLNRSFSDFVAYFLVHMNTEEENLIELSQKSMTPEELIGIRSEIQSKTPPDRYLEWMKYMLPALNLPEISAMFQGLKDSAPAPVFENMMRAASGFLPAERYAQLEARLAAPVV